MAGWRSRLAQSLDDGRVGHAAALAHRLQPIATAALFECVNECGHDAGTARTERVADRDGATIDVGLGQIRASICSPGQCRLGGPKVRAGTP